jgi:hypothetical protein
MNEKETLKPLTILIHPRPPHDSKIFGSVEIMLSMMGSHISINNKKSDPVWLIFVIMN